MYQARLIEIATIIAFFPFSFCVAEDVPSNSLQVAYTKSAPSEASANNLLNLDTFYHIPVATYQYLDNVFTSFYQQFSFNTAITDSTFENNAHYELFAIPLVAENNQGLQIELFGNFSNPTTQYFSNFSSDQALCHYYSNTEPLNFYHSTFSVGAGISFNTSANSKIKMLISNNEMPGYGKSNALIGFETRF